MSPIRLIRKGFTLIEILFALAIGGMILVFASQFLVDINRDWTVRDEARFFEEHVSGVMRFLDGMLQKNIGDPRLTEEERYPKMERPAGMIDLGTPVVRFKFIDGTPLLVGLEDPEGPLTAYFTVEEDEGLVIYWHSDLRLEVEGIEDMNRTLVTPWISSATFIYYQEDEERWEEEEELLEEGGEPKFPDRVKFTFRYNEDIEVTRTLVMPRIEENAFLY